MIVYIPNDDVMPICEYIWRCANSANAQKPTQAEEAALQRMFKQIDFEKKNKPYQMWLSNKEERHVEDSVTGAGPVDDRRAAGRNGVRKGRKKRK